MNINFVTVLGDEIASKRLRINILAQALQDMGHVPIISNAPLKDADIVVFSKHKRADESEMAIACKGKTKIVFDLCDDHFQGSKAGHYLRMCSLADVVTVSTPQLAERVYWYTGMHPKIIHDPYENGIKAAKAPSQKKRVLWHGHGTNLNALKPLPEEYSLRVLCNKPSEIGDYRPWSMEELEEGLEWCDVVIIPQTDDKKNLVKTHNKATTSLRAGRYVVASPWPEAYSVYPIWRGDIEEGLKWAFENPENAMKVVEKCQQISEQFSPESMAKAWLEAVA